MKAVPTLQKNRVISLDIIRGFALFGILFANMASFKSPVFQLESVSMKFTQTPLESLDRWSAFFIDLLITGKFYPMFSFLFGIGFYLFYERLQKQNLHAKRLFMRRMVFLLLLGSFHLVFIWSGDILHTYAAAGFLLILFVNRKGKWILTWALVLIIGSAFMFFLLTTAGNYVMMQEGTSSTQEMERLIESAHKAYQGQSYTDLLTYRASHEVAYIVLNLPFVLPNILGLFLLGVLAGRKKFIQTPEEHLSLWKKVWSVTFFSGGALSLLYALLTNDFLPLPYWMADGIAEGLNIIAGPLLMFFYVSSFTLLLRKNRMVKLCKPLAAVGQLALTNYLLQSLLCMLIFFGFGLGLFGTVSVTTGIGITILIFAFQLWISTIWLKKFNQGPLEKMWRAWTYR